MYTYENFKTKKQLREAVAAGKKIGVYQPNDMGFSAPKTEGRVSIEGPHYPQPHRWYATAILKDGYIIKVS